MIVVSSRRLEFATEPYIDINPVPRFKAPKTDTRQRANPFSRVEKLAILDAIKELRADAWLFYFLSFETGMRTGEVLALHWNDFDFVGGTVVVDKSMVRRRLKATKTGAGRTVILTKAAQAALAKIPRPIKGGPVFLNAKGTIMKDADHFVSAFNSAIEKTGVLYRRPYTTRSTRATELLAAGVPVKIVADQLGHTEQVCHDRYSGLYVTGEEQVVLLGAEDLMEVWLRKDEELRKSDKGTTRCD
jgi:integrase